MGAKGCIKQFRIRAQEGDVQMKTEYFGDLNIFNISHKEHIHTSIQYVQHFL